MGAFDPDAYLAKTPVTGFDPDAYLAKTSGESQQMQAAKRVGAGLASLADSTVGAVLPFAAQQMGYAAGRAIGRSPEQSQAAIAPTVEALSSPFGKAARVENSPAYQGEASRRIIGFIGENIHKGAGWISSQTGLPVGDIENMIGSMFPLAVKATAPAVGRAAMPLSEIAYRGENALRGGVTSMQNALAATKSGSAAEPQMIGGGAAMTPMETLRQTTANNLRVPINLIKGQITANPEIRRFEIETAKTYPESVGKPLVDQAVAANQNVLRNLDAYIGETGAEFSGLLRPVGKIVDAAIVNMAKRAKAQTDAAYAKARAAGETKELVSYQPVLDVINAEGPTVQTTLAPVLSAVSDHIRKNDPLSTGRMSIDALEDIYQLIGKNAQPGTPNAKYAIDLKKSIREATEGAGGELYADARKLRYKYGKTFEDVAAVDRLLSTKPGYADRRVALEDVFDNVILKGSYDDTHAVGLLLKRGGAEGQQAWKELQGQTIDHIKEQVTKGVARDVKGNPVPSTATMNKLIRDLDSDGKLDYIFGKKGAQELRDLRDTMINLDKSAGGTANFSNTSSAFIRAMDAINKSPLSRIPGVGAAAKYAAESANQNALAAQVSESINYNALSRNGRK